MRAYTLDTKAASAADNIVSRIDQTGKYVGILTRAEATRSDKGTEGIEFSFKSVDGGMADFLTVWTFNANGDQLAGFKVVNAMMTVCKVKAITPTQGTVEKWSAASGNKERFEATIYPELTNKRIGLLLQREEYVKKDGSTGAKMNIYSAFDPDTELTASEILSRKATPETLAKMVSTLKDRPMQKPRGTSYAPSNGGSPAFDDDNSIPFANPYRGKLSYVV